MVFLTFAAVVVLGAQATSLGFIFPMEYKPDIFMVLVIWAGLTTEFRSGLGLAFLGGLAMDLLSGSPIGLLALIYTASALLCHQVRTGFRTDVPAGKIGIVILAVLASGFVVVLSRRFGGPLGFGWPSAGRIVVRALVSGMVAALLLPVLDRSYRGFGRVVGGRGATDR
ncbi:MAG: rod shape-determining protein MreD [Pseudomonadota bacterium]